MRFIDLFAGLGGFHVALRRLGHECVFASESDSTLQAIYSKNFGLYPCGDIREIYEAAVVGRNGDELEVEFAPDYAPGPVRKTCRFEEILDWTVHHENGQKSGGFTERAVEAGPY